MPSRNGLGSLGSAVPPAALSSSIFLNWPPTPGWSPFPGTGSPRSPHGVRVKWLLLMEHYFNVRESLVGLILIVDSRRGLGEQDAAMLEWVLARDRQAHVLLTKADKLNRRDSQRVLQETKTACGDTAVTAQLFSAHAKQGFDEARGVMDRWFETPKI